MGISCEPLCQFSERLFFTTFPHPAPNPALLNKHCNDPDNRPRIRTRNRAGPSTAADDLASYYYFTIDDQLLYLSFFQDWGPLNIAMVYKACILIHELLEDKDLMEHRIVLYSSNDPRRKANAALLMALYVMIVQRRAPWEAFHPIAEIEFMPFRDAGRGPSDFNLNIQDCLWGLWKAMQNGLCDMNEFDVEDYEFYEKVEHGDWNWITPNFIAFASPVDTAWIKVQKEKEKEKEREKEPSTLYSTAPPTKNLALQRKLPTPFLNCLDYFEKRNIKLVVRLNTQLYDRETFLDHGVDHMELYFDDGTNPTDEIVRIFIDTADKIVEAGGVVAVHCKAGLGRTGTLIGAYLIWKYGFTANEAIAFMRIVRPGSVVGPQQQYMYLKQLEWSKWAAVDDIRRQQLASAEPAPVVAPATPPADTDEEFNRMETTPPPSLSHPPVTPSRHVAAAAAHARAIATPGQPRKTPRTKRMAREALEESDSEEATTDKVVVLGPPPTTRKNASKAGQASSSKITSPDKRVTRVTRSTAAGAAAARKGASTSRTPASPVKSTGQQQPPNKIPRLATTKTTTAAKAAVRQKPVPVPAPVNRKTTASPIPSRLPTLIPSKRPGSSLNEVANATTKGAGASSSDAWMTNNAAAVVVPASKTDRPGLRNVRRRRSSFSSADVVA